MFSAAAAVLSFVVLSGCGEVSTTPPPVPSISTSAMPSVEPGLFAVLVSHNAQDPKDHDEAAIVGPDGSVQAQASFTPRPSGSPAVCGAAPWLMPEAYVAAGAVFFVDASGVIRRLQPDGTVTKVASLKFDPHSQLLSFVVSPDGNLIMATILTIPASTTTVPGAGCGTFSGNWTLDTYLVTAGTSSADQVNHQEAPPDSGLASSAPGFKNVLLLGWDSGGPIGEVGADYAVQSSVYPDAIVSGGQLTRLDTFGKAGDELGGSGCTPLAAPVGDRVACTQSAGPAQLSVRTLEGKVLWTGAPAQVGACCLAGGALSPDGTQFATTGRLVQVSSGSAQDLPADFSPVGWTDATTIVGHAGSPTGALGILRTGGPGTVTSLNNLMGTYAGRLS
ncbi:MAG TPA: hypothetical protein VF155_06605 [Candidatus Dormibacteraeota bacterium]